jgi:hypothetical protein
VGEGRVVQLVLLLVIIVCRPPRQQCHCRGRLAAVGHRNAQDRRPTPRLPEAKKKKDIERAYKKMTAKEKNNLMRKLAELDVDDVNDDESAPPSPTPMYLM